MGPDALAPLAGAPRGVAHARLSMIPTPGSIERLLLFSNRVIGWCS